MEEKRRGMRREGRKGEDREMKKKSCVMRREGMEWTEKGDEKEEEVEEKRRGMRREGRKGEDREMKKRRRWKRRGLVCGMRMF